MAAFVKYCDFRDMCDSCPALGREKNLIFLEKFYESSWGQTGGAADIDKKNV